MASLRPVLTSPVSAKISLTFTFVEKYPDEMPEVVIEETENIEDEDDVLKFLKDTVRSVAAFR